MRKKFDKRFLIGGLLLVTIALIGYVLHQKIDLFSTKSISSQFNGDHYEQIQFSPNELSGLAVYMFPVQDIPQIFLKNLDTSKIEQLTFNGDNHYPRFSPDGKQIAYLSHTKENNDDIYLINADGSNKQPLVATSADECFPSWSPDGRKIAFSSDQSGNKQIYIMDIDNKEVTKLTNAATYASMPAWSFDGKRIAFFSPDGGEATRTQIFVINTDGSNLMQMTDYHINTWDGEPVWCPDDSCLLFSRDTGHTRIMVLDLPSKSITPLFGDIFASKTYENSINPSTSTRYFTFVVDAKEYAFDMQTKELYPLDMGYIYSLSLHP